LGHKAGLLELAWACAATDGAKRSERELVPSVLREACFAASWLLQIFLFFEIRVQRCGDEEHADADGGEGEQIHEGDALGVELKRNLSTEKQAAIRAEAVSDRRKMFDKKAGDACLCNPTDLIFA
jgi:hypothetical protein